MAGGNVYIPVTGNAVNNGIMLMDASSGGGEEVSGIWLNWNSNGFTGLGWFDEETGIETWWGKNYGKDSGYNSLGEWITGAEITDLSEFFNQWPDYEKGQFIYNESHRNIYETCTTPV